MRTAAVALALLGLGLAGDRTTESGAHGTFPVPLAQRTGLPFPPLDGAPVDAERSGGLPWGEVLVQPEDGDGEKRLRMVNRLRDLKKRMLAPEGTLDSPQER